MNTGCYFCKHKFPKKEVLIINRISVCRNCFIEQKKECHACRAILLKKFSATDGNNYYCNLCFSTLFFTCYNCECLFSLRTNLRHRLAQRTGSFCDDCYNSLLDDEGDAIQCYVCHNSTVKPYCNLCERYFCDNCIQFHSHETNFIGGTKNGEIITVPRFVGLEIEVEKGDIKKLWKSLEKTNQLTHDGSLDRETGVEILTPPCSLDVLEKQVNKVCEVLIKSDYKATMSCGLHVHIDGRKIVKDSKKIVQLVQTIYAVEDMLFSMIPPSRWTSKYCQRLSEFYQFKNFDGKAKIDALESVWYNTKNNRIKEERKRHKYDDTRYAGFNLHSLFFRGTVEFRYHSSTINSNKILAWVEILLKIFNYAMERYNPKEITRLFDMRTSSDKLVQMKEIFGLSDNIYEYMKLRIRKFNPNYVVQFNKGKIEREEIEIKNELYLKSLSKKYLSLKTRINKIDKKLHLKLYGSEERHGVYDEWVMPIEYLSVEDVERLEPDQTETNIAFSTTTISPSSINMPSFDSSSFYKEMMSNVKEKQKKKPKENLKLKEKRNKLINEANLLRIKISSLLNLENKQEGFLKKGEVFTLSDMLKKGFLMRKDSETETEDGEEMKIIPGEVVPF